MFYCIPTTIIHFEGNLIIIRKNHHQKLSIYCVICDKARDNIDLAGSSA